MTVENSKNQNRKKKKVLGEKSRTLEEYGK
jgi:hypothetical protein